jgi:hypothetical protein
MASVNECHVSPVGPTLPNWTNDIQPCGNRCSLFCWGLLLLCCNVALGAEVALSWLATWHVGGAHMSGQYSGGPHMAEVGQWGAATWHPLSPFNPACACMFGTPSLHPEVLLSPSCTQRGLDQISALWSAYLICFIFSDFILIAPLVQKSCNFHHKSLNSWSSPL